MEQVTLAHTKARISANQTANIIITTSELSNRLSFFKSLLQRPRRVRKESNRARVSLLSARAELTRAVQAAVKTASCNQHSRQPSFWSPEKFFYCNSLSVLKVFQVAFSDIWTQITFGLVSSHRETATRVN